MLPNTGGVCKTGAVVECKWSDVCDFCGINVLCGISVLSALGKIIATGYQTLNLQCFFTCGHDEVRAWTIMVGVYVCRREWKRRERMGGGEGGGGGVRLGERGEVGKGERERGGTKWRDT